MQNLRHSRDIEKQCSHACKLTALLMACLMGCSESPSRLVRTSSPNLVFLTEYRLRDSNLQLDSDTVKRAVQKSVASQFRFLKHQVIPDELRKSFDPDRDISVSFEIDDQAILTTKVSIQLPKGEGYLRVDLGEQLLEETCEPAVIAAIQEVEYRALGEGLSQLPRIEAITMTSDESSDWKLTFDNPGASGAKEKAIVFHYVGMLSLQNADLQVLNVIQVKCDSSTRRGDFTVMNRDFHLACPIELELQIVSEDKNTRILRSLPVAAVNIHSLRSALLSQ